MIQKIETVGESSLLRWTGFNSKRYSLELPTLKVVQSQLEIDRPNWTVTQGNHCLEFLIPKRDKSPTETGFEVLDLSNYLEKIGFNSVVVIG